MRLRVAQDSQIFGKFRLAEVTEKNAEGLSSKENVLPRLGKTSNCLYLPVVEENSQVPENVTSENSEVPVHLLPSDQLIALDKRRADFASIMKELKIAEVTISSGPKHVLISILDKNLAAFAITDDDLGHTTRI